MTTTLSRLAMLSPDQIGIGEAADPNAAPLCGNARDGWRNRILPGERCHCPSGCYPKWNCPSCYPARSRRALSQSPRPRHERNHDGEHARIMREWHAKRKALAAAVPAPEPDPNGRRYRCARCEQQGREWMLPASAFYLRPGSPKGLSCYCRRCVAEDQAERRLLGHAGTRKAART